MESDESWRDGSVGQRNLHMLNSEFMADCTFVVGNTKKKKFLAHKNILSHGSAVFNAMFNGGLPETGEVQIDDIEPQHFRKLLEFIYSDNTQLENVESGIKVLYVAKKYMVNTLTQKCIKFIKDNLTKDNVCRALEFARLIESPYLESETLQYLRSNARDVLKSSSFPKIERATLLTILNEDDLSFTTELELFVACISWATHVQQRKANLSLREVLGFEVLGLIRFLNMKSEEFATVVIRSKILQLQEEKDILYRIVTGNGDLPRGFNTNTKMRAALGPREVIGIDQNSYVASYTGDELNGAKPFSFSVNFENYLLGLQLRGLSEQNREDEPSLQDSFEVKLLHSSKLLKSVKFEGKWSLGEPMDLNFTKPILLNADTCYTLLVMFSNLNKSYETTYCVVERYVTTSDVTVNVDYETTAISQIYIAKKIV